MDESLFIGSSVPPRFRLEFVLERSLARRRLANHAAKSIAGSDSLFAEALPAIEISGA